MLLTQILQHGCLKVPLESREKQVAILELINLLHNSGAFKDKDTVVNAVLTREKTRSTGIGSAIAIPHGKCNAVKELVMAIGIAKEPIEFQSVDGVGVKIILLLVSPADQTGPHIQALARISRLMLDDKFKTELENAEDADHAYELLSKRETQQ
ncbi:MAG: PTS sugar transporter subunit IIA [Sedimentisphaerales bacterium]|nr:PTS sugar transporter subunit IIA [Sedimentisphaerales bacterium]